MNRDDLIREFWKVAKNHKYTQPYSAAAHHLINLLTTKETNMFVPKKSVEKEVTLSFDQNGCTLMVEGVRVLSLRGSEVVLHKFVSSTVTGLDVYPETGHVRTRVEL